MPNQLLFSLTIIFYQLRDGAVVKMAEVGRLLASNGIEVKHQGIGSTPSCSQTASEGASIYTKLTEIHPGNYVFYDLQQEMVKYNIMAK